MNTTHTITMNDTKNNAAIETLPTCPNCGREATVSTASDGSLYCYQCGASVPKPKALTGTEAIDYAESNGLTLNHYTTPIEEGRMGISIDDARKIAAEDPSLIWVAVR